MSSRDETLVFRGEGSGEGALTSGRRRSYILTSDRILIIRGERVDKSVRLAKIEKIEAVPRRNSGVLGILLLVMGISTISVYRQLRSPWVFLGMPVLVAFLFGIPWFFWKDLVIRIETRDGEVVQERVLRAGRPAANQFVEATARALAERGR